jgi:hypothetical protein
LTVKLINQDVILNQDVFNDILEIGITLDRPKSDNAASNGVWHHAKAHFMVKYRKPTAVYWDVSAFEEIKKLPAFYKRANRDFTRLNRSGQPYQRSLLGLGSFSKYKFFTISIFNIKLCYEF